MLGLALALPAVRQVPFYGDATVALDFKTRSLYRNGDQLTSDLTALTGYSYARSGPKGRFGGGSTITLATANNPLIISGVGFYAESAATNLLLNTDALSTQSVSVTAQAYTLTFYGTGTITLSGTSTAGPLVGTGAGQRVTLTFTPTAGTLTLTVSGSVEYAMLQTGSFATSYVPSAGSAASTGADALSITGLTAVTEGTLFLRANLPAVAATQAFGLQLDDGTNNNRVTLMRNSTGNARVLVFNGATQANFDSVAWPAGSSLTIAARLKASDFGVSVNRGAVATVVSGSMPAGLTNLRVGVGASGVSPFNGIIEEAILFPAALTDAQLAAL